MSSRYQATTGLKARWFAFVLVGLLLSSCSVVQRKPCCDKAAEPTSLTSTSLSVLTLNIAHGRDQSINQMLVSDEQTYVNLDDIAALIKRVNPDFAALQEADGPSGWSGDFDHVDHIASRLGWANHAHGLHAESWLYAYGTAVLSPHALTGTYVHSFEPSFPTTVKGFVTATTDWQLEETVLPVTVYSVHLDFSRRSVRESQVAELAAHIKEVAGSIIVAGDFNSTLEDTDSPLNLLLAETGLQVWQPEADNLGTYKSTSGDRLDWILISPDLSFESYEVLSDEVSDHFAVVARIKPATLSP